MSGRRALRIVSAVPLLGWSAALLVRPRGVAAALAGRPTPPAWLVRLLGARQLVQQLVVLAVPTPAVARVAAAVDGVHALSMLGATALAPRHRRAELVSAGVAVASAAATLAGAGSDREWSPPTGGR
jgi:hypothetical protein